MQDTLPSISHKQLLKADKDYEHSAALANLVYVNDRDEGIVRVKRGKNYIYQYNNKSIKEEKEIARIKKLAIPPSWTNVWICRLENGHIQATGNDLRQRKQYRYHAAWNLLRKETKFHHLYEFGNALPLLRKKLEEDLAKKELTQEKVLATVISLMEQTYIRVGNNGYEKLYGSYGLTTLKDKHAQIRQDKIDFCFVGKKGVVQKITIRNKRLARVVKECRDIPGKELFQYYDAEGNRRPIDASMVNNYIRSATGMDFSAKDFRTWAGSLHALQFLHAAEEAATEADVKKNIIDALDAVSSKLGNTRTVCRKYYIHPGIIRLYEEKKLARYSSALNKKERSKNTVNLSVAEVVLLKILKSA